MRILHLFDLYLPHTMNWVWRQMRALPECEHWVAAPWMLRNEYSSPEFHFFERPLQRVLHWFPGDEWQAAWFSTNLIRLEKHRPFYREWLEKQLAANPPDVLHAHFAPAGCHFLPLAKKLKIPLVTSFYGFDFERLPFEKPAYRPRYRQLFQEAEAITCTGNATKDILVAQGCPAEKITPIPLSIRPEDFVFTLRARKPGQLRLLQLATITEKKGQLDTLAALKIALPHCPNLHLTLAGERQDKQLFRQIRQFVATHHLGEHVALLDFVPHLQLPQFFSQFDAFIHPSHYSRQRDCEGSPVVILEAQAAGLPVLSTMHADIPGQVLHERTGFLAPERNPELLAAFIQQLYRMEDSRFQQLRQAARRHVEQDFDLGKNSQKLAALYQAIRIKPFP